MASSWSYSTETWNTFWLSSCNFCVKINLITVFPCFYRQLRTRPNVLTSCWSQINILYLSHVCREFLHHMITATTIVFSLTYVVILKNYCRLVLLLLFFVSALFCKVSIFFHRLVLFIKHSLFHIIWSCKRGRLIGCHQYSSVVNLKTRPFLFRIWMPVVNWSAIFKHTLLTIHRIMIPKFVMCM